MHEEVNSGVFPTQLSIGREHGSLGYPRMMGSDILINTALHVYRARGIYNKFLKGIIYSSIYQALLM